LPKFITRLLPLLLLFVHFNSASAQQPSPAPNLKLGDAVVTGFSGTITPDAAKKRPRNQSANDLTFINPDGLSARIVDVSKPGYVWDGRLFQAPKTFDVLAKDVGQVFGVALDDQTPPNIYVAATSVFGLNIVSRGRDGSAERKTKGGPGAGWMKGQFGLDLQGGPGGIYKIDGRTGVASLFANVTLDGVPNPGPGLGNLAYDSAHKQLFVSDFYTGMIHRFDLDGKELSRYDHGVTGLGAAKLATLAFNPKDRPNIANARFDSEKPATWGFAPAARRTWGLAVHDGRLYYAVVAGPQIWSVGIERDGNFAADPRWELDVPAQAGPLPVSDIVFAQSGAMILAQRGLIAGAYDYSAFTQPGEPQVLRFWLKAPNDPPSPGRWKLIPEEFAVGFAGNYRNSNGGVALGYGYGSDGMLNAASCEAALWTTGQNLRNNPALRSQLEPGGPLVVHGLQGSPADLLRKANEPPATSYFVDYDDKFDDPRASGHMGSVRIFAQPCAGAVASRPVAPVIATLIGTSSRPQACTPTCVCPNGGVLKDGKCVEVCPPPQVLDPVTGACKCPPRTVLRDGKCVPILTIAPPHECLPPLVLDPLTGLCVPPKHECVPPLVLDPLTGLCVPPKHECVPPLVLDPVTGSCVCPNGGVLVDGKCVPQICPSPLVPGPCECPDGTVRDGQLCLPTKPVDVGIVKTGGTTPYCPAPFYGFTITVTNGPTPWNGTGNIVVTDTVPANMTFAPIPPPWSCLPLGPYTAGTTFSCSYTGPPLAANQVLPPINISATATIGPPFPPYVNCASVAIPLSSGYVDSNAANNNFCTLPVLKPAACTCPPPQVPNIDGICACPAPMQPGAVPGQCICPLPNVMVNGVCVPPPVCPQGQVLVGGACVPTPPVCTAPQVPNVDGICACPAPMQPGAVPGQCICPLPNVMVNGVCVLPPPVCPQGQVLVGGACVPTPPVCTAPQVPNVDGICACPAPMQPGPTPGSCKCPEGMTLVGGVCVTPPPPVRKQPDKVKKPQACPEGTIKQGSKCVKRESKQPRVTPSDVINGIGIIRGIGGGGGGGGGGGSPSKGKP
jgi:hypothetical protein